jgi:hypothetical protein
MNYAELAITMNQKESDVIAFVECLKVWIAKGYSIEGAIARHMSQMERLVNNAHKIDKSVIVECFYG